MNVGYPLAKRPQCSVIERASRESRRRLEAAVDLREPCRDVNGRSILEEGAHDLKPYGEPRLGQANWR